MKRERRAARIVVLAACFVVGGLVVLSAISFAIHTWILAHDDFNWLEAPKRSSDATRPIRPRSAVAASHRGVRVTQGDA